MRGIRATFDSKGYMDIYLQNGRAELIADDNEMIQALKYELESNLGQWYLGTDFGIPMFQDDESGLLDIKVSTNDDFQNAILDITSKRKEIISAIVNSIIRENKTENITEMFDQVMSEYNTMNNESVMSNIISITRTINNARTLRIEMEIKTIRGVVNLTINL